MVYLKYGSTIMSFIELDWKSKPELNSISGDTLRGITFEHINNARRVYDITISADAIDTQLKYDFLEAFFCNGSRQISFNGTNYIDVVMKAGDFPVDWLENARDLPQVKFTLRAKSPGITRATGEQLMNSSGV